MNTYEGIIIISIHLPIISGQLATEDLDGIMGIAEEYMMAYVRNDVQDVMKKPISLIANKDFIQLAEKYSFHDVIDHWLKNFTDYRWTFDKAISYRTNVWLIGMAIKNCLTNNCYNEYIRIMTDELIQTEQYKLLH